MSDKITVEAAETVPLKKDKKETWISRGFAEHMVIVGKNQVAKFKDYALVLDMDKDDDKTISDGLHRCGREGIDVFVVGKPYSDSDIGKRTEMLKLLRDMNITQLRAMLTLDEMLQSNIPVNTTDKELLITLILRLKGLRGIKA